MTFCLTYLSDAKRKLGFTGKEGYDIFGNNIFFAPGVRWENLLSRVESVKNVAEKYEDAFNDIICTMDKNNDIREVSDWKNCLLAVDHSMKVFYST